MHLIPFPSPDAAPLPNHPAADISAAGRWNLDLPGTPLLGTQGTGNQGADQGEPAPAPRTPHQGGGTGGATGDGNTQVDGGGGTGPAPQTQDPCSNNFFFIMIAVMAVFLFISSRTQKKQQKQREEMLGGIQKNDDVVLNSGIYGKVERVDELTLKVRIADNVSIKVDKAAVSKVGEVKAAGSDGAAKS